MNKSEAKDILINRVGWRDDNTVEGFTLSTENTTSNSGRVFQSEHSAVTLANIRDTQPVRNISEEDFNQYLEDIREQVVMQVLSDALERDYVDDNLFTVYPSSFDNAILLRMVIVVSEQIMTTTRFNAIARFGEDFVGKLNYDIYRDAPNKFAIREANYGMSMGISTRYRFEIQSLQRRFGDQRNRIKTITAGQALKNPYESY